MATRESSLWNNLKSALPINSHAVRIENSVELGTPDVNLYLPEVCDRSVLGSRGIMKGGWAGWVELKVQEAPVRKTTTFRCEHFTMEQRQWLVDRCRAGGNAYLLLQVESAGKTALPGAERFLWVRGDIAAVWVGQCTLSELIERCEWVGDSLGLLVKHLRE